jgi:hypothetical protein
MVHNPFGTDTAAHFYATARPDYSALVTALIRQLTGIMRPVARTLDQEFGHRSHRSHTVS